MISEEKTFKPTLEQRLKHGAKMLFVGVALAASLVGCAKPIEEGTVYYKKHEPERSWVQLVAIPHIHRIGKVTTTSFTYIPMFHHDDEDWVIGITKYNDETGKSSFRTVYVESNTYARLKNGDYFNCNSNRCSDSDNIVKANASEQQKAQYGVKPVSSDSQ